MQMNKKRTFTIFLIINLLVFLLSISFYYVYIKAFELDFAEKHIQNAQTIFSNTLDNKINTTEQYFNELVDDYSITELNSLTICLWPWNKL